MRSGRSAGTRGGELKFPLRELEIAATTQGVFEDLLLPKFIAGSLCQCLLENLGRAQAERVLIALHASFRDASLRAPL